MSTFHLFSYEQHPFWFSTQHIGTKPIKTKIEFNVSIRFSFNLQFSWFVPDENQYDFNALPWHNALRSKVIEWFKCLAVWFRTILAQSKNAEGRIEIIMLVPICKYICKVRRLFFPICRFRPRCLYIPCICGFELMQSSVFSLELLLGFGADILHLRILWPDGIKHTEHVAFFYMRDIWNVEYKVTRRCK